MLSIINNVRGFLHVLLPTLSLLVMLSAAARTATADGNISAGLDSGLVVYWDFNDGTAVDRSGNAHDGTLYGPSPGMGMCESGLYFDGIGDYVMADPVDVDYLSIVLWVNYAEFRATSSTPALVSNGHYYLNQGFMLYQSPGSPYNRLIGFVSTPNGTFRVTAPRLLNTNQWYHVAMIYDGSHLAFYFDGELDTLISATGMIIPTTAQYPLLVGATYQPGVNTIFQGLIDEVRLYDRPLSIEEIRALYENCPVCDCRHIGDCNDDGKLDPTDIIYLINYALRNGAAPPVDADCPMINRGDVNCDSRVNLVDIAILVRYIYRPPVAPLCNPCAR